MGELKAPHVLVLGTLLGQDKGGVWRHNKELLPRAARLLTEGGGSLSVLEGREPCAFDLPAEVERIPTEVPARPVMRRAMTEGRWLRRVLDEREVQGRPIDLVHTAHQPVPRGVETPLSLLIHDLRSLQLRHSPFSRRLLAREIIGRSARRAAVLLTVSEAMADSIAESLQVERGSIRIVPNAGDHFDPLPRSVEPEAPLLCIGHLEPRKNQRLLIDALVLEATLPDVWFVGASKGDEQERLQAHAQERGVGQRVHFLGAVDDKELFGLLSRASCVVLPSLLEGFGISVLEARLAGVPLAVSAIPAHLEVAREVPSFGNDPRECARAIEEALATSDERLDANRRLAREHYSWDDSAKRLVDAWSSVGIEDAP